MPARPWLTPALAAILIFAPLFSGGQQPLALAALQLAALGLLAATLWRPAPLAPREWIALALLGLLPLIYLIPLPLGLASALPGRAPYLEVWGTAFGDARMPSVAALSLIPDATETAWLTLAIPIAVYVATRSLPPARVMTPIYVLLAVAAGEAILGLMQFGDGPDSPLYLGMEYAHFGSAVGTYTNRNHLAGLIAMVLPVVLALLFYSAGQGREPRRRDRAAFFASTRGQEALTYAGLAVLLLVAVTFTRSRMGLALAMLGILLSVALFARRIGGNNAFGPAGTLVAVALGLAAIIGLVPVLDRFAIAGVLEDLRWAMFESVLTAIGSFFPLGSGPGTFAEVFPAFQPPELGRWLINRAHNDYLEWAMEGGALAIALGGFLLYLYAAQWRKVWATGEWSRPRFVQVGAGIGIGMILLHELVDYNLRTPANLAYFALLLGIFFSDACAAESAGGPQRTRRTGRLGEGDDPVPAYRPVAAFKPAPDQIENPFLDD